jgi:hypothetical protein
MIKLRRIRWAGHAAYMGERRGAYRGLVGKPDGKNKRRGEDNIKMDLKDVGCGGVEWIDLAEERDKWWVLVKAVTNLRVA